MFERFFDVMGLRSSQKFFTRDLELLVKGYAVAIFVDEKVENIEIFVADRLFVGYIDKTFPTLDEKQKKDLKLVCHSKLIDFLVNFKEDSSEFENIKNDFYLELSKQSSQKMIEDIKIIIDSDNVFADEEKEFFARIVKYPKTI